MHHRHPHLFYILQNRGIRLFVCVFSPSKIIRLYCCTQKQTYNICKHVKYLPKSIVFYSYCGKFENLELSENAKNWDIGKFKIYCDISITLFGTKT